MNNDLISREALKKHKVRSEERHEYVVPVYNIDNAPTVFSCNACKNMGNERECVDCHDYSNYVHYDERPQGEWEFVFDDKVNNRFIYQCSECGRSVSVYSSDALIPVYPFCHCGAKMRKGGSNG